MVTITYPTLKQDDPHHDTGVYSLGIKGWGDGFDVYADGVKIGALKGDGPTKRSIEYGFTPEPGSALATFVHQKWPRLVAPTGRAAAKALVKKLVEKYLA